MAAQEPECECAIVKPDSMSQARASTIERDRGDENRVEKTRAQVIVTFGLVHSERVPDTSD